MGYRIHLWPKNEGIVVVPHISSLAQWEEKNQRGIVGCRVAGVGHRGGVGDVFL